ncbi:HLA class II histocompatibility antigen, DP beta 1 chain [Denticeps clupeoides]|uniref:Beta-2-microglobulin n=1 Tax=Denticeps clupeoides TaxID=299321 RepID=A0AAY4C2S6_9TELE|nr:HLA class II histocompatibility antigen, DP beta 1 chain-like [Denticeps clupeoides]
MRELPGPSSVLLCLCFQHVLSWTDYQYVGVASYTRTRSDGSLSQEVVVLVNEAVFAYFDPTQETFVLRPSASAGFGVLDAAERVYCVSEVTKSFPRQQDYLERLTEKTGSARPPKASPSVSIYTHFPATAGARNVLYCYATGFYPGDIEISVLLNGRPFPGKVVTSDLVYGEDWTFRVFKYTNVTPQPGEEYACLVKHSSMAEPKTISWRPEEPPDSVAPPPWTWAASVAVGAAVGGLISLLMLKRSCFWQ